MSRRFFPIVFLICGLVAIVSAQKQKPWTEWDAKEVKKTLDNSGWGQVQTDTDTHEMMYSPTATASSGSTRGAAEGVYNQATSTSYHIRFLSAKPIREAVIRNIELAQKKPANDQQKSFIDNKIFEQYIVVSVVFEGADGRATGRDIQTFGSANSGVLKNVTYLERKDGKRLFLTDYRAPSSDGLGAKFFFTRLDDGKPFITAETGTVRFYSEMPSPARPDPNSTGSSTTTNILKLNMRFKTADMMFDGKLEY
jgi:hypothetical protein